MPIKTFPDYGRYPDAFTSPDIDLTELAARLGSIDTMRRDGKIIFFDPFEVLSWNISLSGTGAAAVIAATPTFRGASSVRLTPGSTSGFFAQVSKSIPLLPNRRIGLEITEGLNAATAGGHFLTIQVVKYENTNVYTAGMRLHYGNQQMGYWNGIGGWSDVLPIHNPAGNPPQWANIKIVIDFVTNQTIHMSYNEQSVNVNAVIQTQTPGGDQGDNFNIKISATDTAGTQKPVYLTDFIMTMDEP